jgi:hypothetical protein
MAVHHTTLPAKAPTQSNVASTNGCRCGCAPCDEACCSLDCLVQPRFFCGQLLTDQDLTTLLEWTKDKHRLVRYRDGWGVVCGLEVRCDPLRHGTVVVAPGYAIDPCGEDIVLCEETALDLSSACGPDIDPCVDLPLGQPAKSGIEARYREYRESSESEDENETEERDVIADVYVRYREEEAEPVTALGRGVCGEVAACEPSRTRELFELRYVEGTAAADPVALEAMRWEEGFARCAEVVPRFRDAFASLSGADSEAIRRWLVRWIDDHPLHQFCSLRHEICELDDADLQEERTIGSILFAIVQDCRNAYLTCACACGVDAPGVPLARLWLHADGTDGCHVRQVDPYPPYRRPLRASCWPARHGEVNVGRLIWHRWEEACTILDDLGVTVSGSVDFEVPPTLAELENELDCRPFVACDQAVVAQVIDAGDLGRRVVGFCGMTRGTVGLRVDKSSTSALAPRGEEVTYTLDVWNTGSEDLDLEIDDVPVGHIASERLAAGTSKRWEYTYEVPVDAAGELRNTVTVVGTADDGRVVTQTDTHTITVPEPQLPLTIRVEKDADLKQAIPGEAATYTFVVHNTSDVPLTIGGEDDVYGTIVQGERLEPGDRWEDERQLDVVANPGETVTNTFKVTAQADDGRTVDGSATHSVRVVKRGEDDLGLVALKTLVRGTPTPGSTLTYGVTVKNTGARRLELAFDDPQADVLPAGIFLEPDEEQTVPYRSMIPEGYSRPVWTNTVKVTGTAESGEQTTAEDTHQLKLRIPELQPEDELRVIFNIGEVRAERLREAGISTRDALADLTPTRLAGIINVSSDAASDILRAAREGRER